MNSAKMMLGQGCTRKRVLAFVDALGDFHRFLQRLTVDKEI